MGRGGLRLKPLLCSTSSPQDGPPSNHTRYLYWSRLVATFMYLPLTLGTPWALLPSSPLLPDVSLPAFHSAAQPCHSPSSAGPFCFWPTCWGSLHRPCLPCTHLS